MNKTKKLYDGDYIGFFDNGEIGVSDGVGYAGAMDKEEVKELYDSMKKYFEEVKK